uniref:Uncharacterized protein n=1 Tax=Solanum lycopersicum TaxID=4081 RepID=A0A3Q7GIN1_SOLLC
MNTYLKSIKFGDTTCSDPNIPNAPLSAAETPTIHFNLKFSITKKIREYISSSHDKNFIALNRNQNCVIGKKEQNQKKTSLLFTFAISFFSFYFDFFISLLSPFSLDEKSFLSV